MKQVWKQMLFVLLTIVAGSGVCFQAFAAPGSAGTCPGVYLPQKEEISYTFMQRLFLPKAIVKFDYDLYWKVRTSDLNSTSFSKKELKSLEMKIALLDRANPATDEASKGPWLSHMTDLSILRARQFKQLLSSYSPKDLQDGFLRRQFITQLYLLNETPLLGLGKSIDLTITEDIKTWAARNLEAQAFNVGLEGLLKEFHFASPGLLGTARLYLKKALSTGLPGLPLWNKSLDSTTMENLLWAGMNSQTDILKSKMLRDHLVDNYNQLRRAYFKTMMVIFIPLMYFEIPHYQDQIIQEVQKQQEAQMNSPEAIRARDEAFKKSMAALDKINQQIDALSKQASQADPKEQLYEETLQTFESLNHRSATAKEREHLREKLGLK